MFEGLLRFENFELDCNVYDASQPGQKGQAENSTRSSFLPVERRNYLVSLKEIVERIWSRGIFFDRDMAINSAVRKIRRALQDDSVSQMNHFQEPVE